MQENGFFGNQHESKHSKPDLLDLFKSYPVTTSLISINVLIFLAMCISGVSTFEPSVTDIIHWGGNMRIYTFCGDWWRLITNVFEHIGLFHIALNMIALFQLGFFLEKMVGWRAYLAVYLSTGVLASLVSLWWAGYRVSAGASGAIFGLFGFFLALLLTNLIEKSVRMALLKSVGLIIVLNLGFGMQGNIDNAAHIGGLLSGIVFGFLIYLFIIQRKSLKLYSVIVVAMAIAISAAYLVSQHDKGMFERAFINMQVNEKQAINAQNTLNIKNGAKSLQEINTVILPLWAKVKKTIDSTNTLKLNDKQAKFRHSLQYYIGLRTAHINIIKAALEGDTSSINIQKLPIVRNGIDSILKDLNAQ